MNSYTVVNNLLSAKKRAQFFFVMMALCLALWHSALHLALCSALAFVLLPGRGLLARAWLANLYHVRLGSSQPVLSCPSYANTCPPVLSCPVPATLTPVVLSCPSYANTCPVVNLLSSRGLAALLLPSLLWLLPSCCRLLSWLS